MDPSTSGFTLIELVIVVAIVGILAAAVLPLAHWSVKRQREYELQESLRIIRNAIDRYHDLALAGLIELEPGGTGYPPDLDVLVEGVELTGEIPSPVPGASDAFGATGAGLTGGLAGAVGQQAFNGGISGNSITVTTREGRGESGSAASLTITNPAINELRAVLGQRAGGLGLDQAGRLGLGQQGSGPGGRGGLGTRGGLGAQGGRGFAGGARSPAFGGAARRTAAGRPTGDVADLQKIVLLRRLPVDPLTGSTEWGLRCYGDSIEDRSWCGRNVFDVYTKALGDGIDGRPYREW
jgi:prepilin-type N-terminal cleavage/methylation domain-containing protein